MSLTSGLRDRARLLRDELRLPRAARAERGRDRRGRPSTAPEPPEALRAALDWLCAAQDRSRSADGGVARHYSLLDGWASSYPETTGYIVPTFLEQARLRNDETLRARGRRMLDWLVSIQFPDGGFQGGTIGAEPKVPVTFNTGQILLGLASGVAEWGDDYREPMNRAARWLAESQDPDGCWRNHPTPFAATGEKAYETHVSWGLLEAARQEPDAGHERAAYRNVEWALERQHENGWFGDCCLQDPDQPLTHTLGYVLRGVLEAHRFRPDSSLLEAAAKTADGLLAVQLPNGSLPGRLDRNWRPTVGWSCLTGNVQISYCWLMLYRWTGEQRYREAASAANRFVASTVRIDGDEGTRGGVKGSFPVSGGYGAYQYLNWAAKFFVDALTLDDEIRSSESS